MSETHKPNDNPLFAALLDAAATAGIALLLFGLLIGLRTTDAPGGLILVDRPGLLATIIGIVFITRLARHLLGLRPAKQKVSSHPLADRARELLGEFTPHLASTALILVIAVPILSYLAEQVFGASIHIRYWLDLGILVLTYVMLGWGLNIVVGLAGLLDLGYVAFYAIGAYSYALLAQHFGWSFWLCLPLAGILAASWGVILGFPVLRLRGDYLAIVTLAFGEIIRVVLLNWYQFTGGPNGLSGIPRPSFFGLPFDRGENGFAAFFGLDYSPLHRILFLYYLILALALLTNYATHRMRRLPIGRAWEALREDEIACRSLGINTTTTKLTAFATGAMFGGFAGSFFATRQGFISPESFTFIESAIILAIVVLGGMGSQIGVVIASIVMIGGFELLRNMDWLKSLLGSGFDPAQYRMLLFGLAMAVIMVLRPRGLISTRMPTVFLKRRKAVGAEFVKEGHG